MGPNLKHSAGSLDIVRTVTKAGIEEAGIVDAKLAISLIERHHLRCEVWGDANPFPGRKNVKVAGLENQVFIRILMYRFPELLGGIEVDLVESNCRSIFFGPIGNDFALVSALQIDGNSEPALNQRSDGTVLIHVNQRLFLVQVSDGLIAGTRAAVHEPQLTEPHPRSNRDRECAGDDLRVKFAFVPRYDSVKFGTVVGNQAGENIKPPVVLLGLALPEIFSGRFNSSTKGMM